HRDPRARRRVCAPLPPVGATRAALLRLRLRLQPDRPLGRARQDEQHGAGCPRRAPRIGVGMIEPVLKNDAFLADVRSPQPSPENFRLWWLGQSGFLVQFRGRHLLLDPYLSDSLTRKYAATDKPHVRMTARVVAPERLDFIDVATSSHNHTDHLDAETLLPLRGANPAMRLVVPEANRRFVADRLGCDAAFPDGLDDGASVEIAGF